MNLFEKQMRTECTPISEGNLLGYIYIDIRGVIVTYHYTSRWAKRFDENNPFASSILGLILPLERNRRKEHFKSSRFNW